MRRDGMISFRLLRAKRVAFYLCQIRPLRRHEKRPVLPGPFYLPWRRRPDAKGSPLAAGAELAQDEAFQRPPRAAGGQEEDRSANPHRQGLPADLPIQVPQIHLRFSPLAHGIVLEVP